MDFVTEVMGARPFVVVGNSIGGGLGAGLASNVRDLCRGLVLCNTAGRHVPSIVPRANPAHGGHASPAAPCAPLRLLEPEDFDAEMSESGNRTVAMRTLQIKEDPDALPRFQPVPFGGQALLDAFGWGLIQFLQPQVKSLLQRYYPTQPRNADDILADSIRRDSSDPGAANVIASGQKLPAQRPLNELINARHGFGGPVLVPQGALDPLTGAERSQGRAKLLATLRDLVSVALLDAGHCPHDECPAQVAAEIVKWWPQVMAASEPPGEVARDSPKEQSVKAL